eukprot:6178673-Pyramimonas_sp.AAC.1
MGSHRHDEGVGGDVGVHRVDGAGHGHLARLLAGLVRQAVKALPQHQPRKDIHPSDASSTIINSKKAFSTNLVETSFLRKGERVSRSQRRAPVATRGYYTSVACAAPPGVVSSVCCCELPTWRAASTCFLGERVLVLRPSPGTPSGRSLGRCGPTSTRSC